VPAGLDGDVGFLQQRLALYGWTVAMLSGLFLVVAWITHFALDRTYFEDPGRVPHVIATSIAVVLWLVTRQKRTLPFAVLNWLDVGCTIAMGVMFGWMAHQLPPGVGALVGFLAVSYVALGRAATLPSTPGRTFAVSAISFGAVMTASILGPLPPDYPHTMVGHVFAFLDPALWTISGSLLATLASRVIYGLQEKVYEARQLGQYTLEAKIGEGGMGQIFRASHAMLRRPTAIKLLPGEHSESQLRRFEREVRLTASLTHPNTISVFDFGRTPEGTFYYAMELLHGLNLETLIERHGVQPPGRVVNILLQVCGALNEAHGVGLIHRDIKPANIYLCRLGGIDDFVKVLDFGLVRQQNQDVSLTQSSTHNLVGTPLYMPPESIIAPDKISAQADLYSLGATAYHLLTGSPPFSGNSVLEVCGHHLHTQPESPSKRLGKPLPDALEQIVLACLAKDPGARPAGAKDLAKRLREADGVPAYDSEDAAHFWEVEHDDNVQRERSVSGQTLHIALGDRGPDRLRDFPKSA
jgi:eukaryotic-like serine/threonine-protein kinase